MRDIMAQMLTLLTPPRKLRHIGLGLSVVILLPFLMLACTKQPDVKADKGGLKTAAASGLPQPGSATRTSPRRPKTPIVSGLPQPEQTLLGFVPNNCPSSVLSMMEHLAGYANMEGSGLYPGALTTKPGKYGSYRIAWTLDVKPGSFLSYDANGLLKLEMDSSGEEIVSPPSRKDIAHSGQTVFRFWLSHDGSRMRWPIIPFSAPSSAANIIAEGTDTGDDRFAYAVSVLHPGCGG